MQKAADMMNGYYSVGEVSKATGISKDTLHFYSKTGLLVPDHIDPQNQYRYYSRWNLWQLDIITMCRKLNVPLKKVKEILKSHDNSKIIELLQEYREEALRLSAYYLQVAEDISWYALEDERIRDKAQTTQIRVEYLKAETVIAGTLAKERP